MKNCQCVLIIQRNRDSLPGERCFWNVIFQYSAQSQCKQSVRTWLAFRPTAAAAAAEGSPVKMLPVIIGLLKSGGAGGQPEPFTLMITITNINTLLPLLPSILQPPTPPSSPQTAEWRRQSCWESHSHTLYNQLCAAVMVLKLWHWLTGGCSSKSSRSTSTWKN